MLSDCHLPRLGWREPKGALARFVALAALVVVLGGCSEEPHLRGGSASSGAEQGGGLDFPQRFTGQPPLKVLCTTGMVADLAREIGGPRVQVTALMGPGVDPHLYKPTPGDIRLLTAADLVLYSGWHLEGKMAEVFSHLASAKPCLAVAEGVPKAELLQDEARVVDPHLWFDVRLWSRAAERVAAALGRYDPAGQAEYAAALARLQAELAALDGWARTTLAEIPRERRVLVTAHDAFRYFGRAYDVEVRGVQGVSTDSEAGVKQINDLVELLVRRKIKAVFVETSVSEQNVRALLEGCQARGHAVRIGGELYSDALGDAGAPEGTYRGMIEHNVRVIARALH